MAQAGKKANTQQNRTGRAFGKELSGIYKVVNFVHKYRLYRLSKFVPYSGVIGFTHFFVKAFFLKSKAMKDRARRDLMLFSGRSFSPRLLARLVEATMKNMGIILFDMMLKAPNYTQKNYRKVVMLYGDGYLESALKAGKGAIVTSLHMGQFLHTLGAIALDPRGFKLVVVANMANQKIFENLITLPAFRTTKVVGRTSYKVIKGDLIQALKANKIVFLMHDIAGNNNLKVPFIYGDKEFLVAVPQGAIALHRVTGAPIVPILAIPRGRLVESTIKFFDPAPLLRISEKCKDLPQKEFHGHMSIEINKTLFPYLVKYLHTWEELITFGTRTFDIKMHFPKGADLISIIRDITGWIQRQIEGSFEPGRNEEALLSWIGQLMTRLQDIVSKAGTNDPGFQLAAKSYIQLGGMGTQAQVEKLLLVMKRLFDKAGLQSGVQVLADNLGKVRDFYRRRD
ncbi:MAG: hypothetical protein Q6373_024105 [Candidatus Sigynarchaeota archaeon]